MNKTYLLLFIILNFNHLTFSQTTKTIYKGTFPPAAQTDDNGKEIGTILFSNKPIILGKEDPKSISDQFNAGDEVYAMAYLQGTWEELGFQNGIKFHVYDAEETGYTWQVEYGDFTFHPKKDGTSTGSNTFYDIDLFVGEKNAYDKYLPKELINALSIFLGKQNSGIYRQFRNHKWTVDLYANYMLIARGVMHYNITKDDVAKVEAMNKSYQNAHLKTFKLPPSKLNDPTLAETLKQVMIKEGLDVKKIIFTTDDWGTIHHKITGAILSRSIWAIVVHKLKDGSCYYDEVQFVEEYVGNKFSGKIRKAGYGTESGAILCENVD